MPPSPHDLAEFAELILNKFIEELEENKQTVAWNYGLDSVVFVNKNTEDYKSLRTIKEEFYVDRDNKSNSTESHGTRDQGNRLQDKTTNVVVEQTKDEQHEACKREEDNKTNSSQKDTRI